MTTVLIVDDEIDMRVLVRVTFELANDGLQVVGEAADGMAALRAWRDLNGPPEPDVVILDNRMPGMSGLEVAELMLMNRPDQIIVLYSAFLDDEVREQAAAIGVSLCVQKGDLEGLPDLVRQLVA